MPAIVDKELSPEERLRSLLEYSGGVEIDSKVSAKLYYKSGLSMFKQFNIYYNESSWENALCIYLKYEKLFFDKIKKHPEYSKIPANVKSINAANFRIIKPKAEHAKRELFKQYRRDYISYVDEMRMNKMKGIMNVACGSNVEQNSVSPKLKQNIIKEKSLNMPEDSVKKDQPEKEIASKVSSKPKGIEAGSNASFQTTTKITELQSKVAETEKANESTRGFSKRTSNTATSSKNNTGPPTLKNVTKISEKVA